MNRMQRRWCVIAGLIVAGVACLPIDVPLSRWLLAGGLPGEVRAIFHRGEVFGHGYGVLAIAITILLVNPLRKRQVALSVAAFAAAGLAANLLKIQFWRVRPYACDSITSVSATFLGSYWWGTTADLSLFSRNALRSFPSGHTAGAVAFAYALGRMYPTARAWFMLLAVLCAGNRIDGGAHFLSDVCWGAALAMIASTWITDRYWPRVARCEPVSTLSNSPPVTKEQRCAA